MSKKMQALLLAGLAGVTFSAFAAEGPVQLSDEEMAQVVAGGHGPGDCTGTGVPVPVKDGTGPKYGK